MAFAAFKSVAEMLTPLLTVSQFEEKGMLTPEEFVRSGDHLVRLCPTWQWAAGKKDMAKSYLPPDKQFLVSRMLPCMRRARDFVRSDVRELTVERGGGTDAEGEGWVETHVGMQDIAAAPPGVGDEASATIDASGNVNLARRIEVLEIREDFIGAGARSASASAATSASAAAAAHSESAATMPACPPVPGVPAALPLVRGGATSAPSAAAYAQALDEVPDMDAVDLGIALVQDDDPSAFRAELHGAKGFSASSGAAPVRTSEIEDDGFVMSAEEPDGFVRTRRYDVSIVYDNYYRTPRVFLFGYDEARNPLTTKQIMEDMSVDHVGQTVTMEAHPHTNIPHASIHPCRHAETMKRLIEQLRHADHVAANAVAAAAAASKSGSAATAAPRVARERVTIDEYLFLFLKFIASVVPTIEYDYTVRV